MATPAKGVDVDGVAVRLTNPDKLYFPRLGSGGRSANWSSVTWPSAARC